MRYLSRLHHVGIGFAVQTQPITLLIADEDMRVSAEDSTLLRQLTPDQNRDSAPGSPAWSIGRISLCGLRSPRVRTNPPSTIERSLTWFPWAVGKTGESRLRGTST